MGNTLLMKLSNHVEKGMKLSNLNGLELPTFSYSVVELVNKARDLNACTKLQVGNFSYN